MTHRNGLWIVCIAWLGAAALALAQSPEDLAWKEVIAEQRAGLRLRDQELSASGDRRARLNQDRVAAFRRATSRMNAFVRDFIPDPASVKSLKATFQLGYYSELAAWDDRALVHYNNCQVHPKLRDREAVFGEPPEPLAAQLPLRIEAVMKRLNAGASQPASVHSNELVVRYTGKGGIDLAGIGAPPALSNQESLRIARRLSFPEDLDRARVEWRRLLETRPELKPVGEDVSVPGMLVFAVKGTDGGAREVASLLDSYRRDLTRRYFDAGLPGPTMVVLANLARPLPAVERPFAEVANMAAPAAMNAAARPLVDTPANAAAQPAARPPEQRTPEQQPVPRAPLRPMEQRAPDRGPAAVSARPQAPQGPTPEEIGRILSATAHFREMLDMEGYFEPLDHTLVLRKHLVAEGGEMFLGTGLHELVHALIQVDYAPAPMWLNEGLAAMHEEFGPTDPHDNYRLYVARSAMNSGRWLTLRDLLEPHTAWWGSDARPVMVAAARYFCMFLWKEGHLPAVYKAMRRAQAADGASTAEVVARVTGMSVERLDERWRQDILRRDVDALDGRWRELRDPIQRYVQHIPPLAEIH